EGGLRPGGAAVVGDHDESSVADHSNMILAVSRGAYSNTVWRITEDTRRADSGRRRSDRSGRVRGSRDLGMSDVGPQASGVRGFVNLAAGVVVEHLPGGIGCGRGCSVCREEVAEAAVDAVAGKSPLVLNVGRSVDSYYCAAAREAGEGHVFVYGGTTPCGADSVAAQCLLPDIGLGYAGEGPVVLGADN